jgi:uncharacterized protein YdhG (YjbR/CyaY superfamily)
MRFELFTQVALAYDIPDKGLRRGDVATIVEHHLVDNSEDGYTLEVFNAIGEIIAVVTVPESALHPLEENKMRTNQTAPQDIDDYIASFPQNVQEILKKIRLTIKKAAPAAEETISYKIPTFTLNGTYLIYFAAYKKHVSLYPAPIGQAEFQAELSAYESGKGTAKFPLDKPIPYDLISKIVRFRVKENLARAEAKGKNK